MRTRNKSKKNDLFINKKRKVVLRKIHAILQSEIIRIPT